MKSTDHLEIREINPTYMNQLKAELRQKIESCQNYLRTIGKIAVAFSAGVDSTFLLALAVDTLGSENVLAAIGISPSLAERERIEGQELAIAIGARYVEFQTGEMSNPDYAANPANRCYFCKNELFSKLGELARENGFDTIASGANADDTGDFRPGLKAGEELGVRNPLLEAGLTKDEIRTVSKAMGLPTWEKPAMACLASRVPYGQEISSEKLSRIEKAEYVLKDLGFRQCRVRDHEGIARIEVPKEDLARIIELREQIVDPLNALGFKYVSLDLKGFRSGSMNEVLTDRDTE